jgi:hypothetical protein
MLVNVQCSHLASGDHRLSIAERRHQGRQCRLGMEISFEMDVGSASERCLRSPERDVKATSVVRGDLQLTFASLACATAAGASEAEI